MQLTPEQVNEFLSKAILESKIGEAVEQSVARVVAELSRQYNNPFDAAIKGEVLRLIEHHVTSNYREQLHARVQQAFAAHLTDEIVSKIISQAVRAMTHS